MGLCLCELFSLATLRATTCAGIHVPTFCAHPIGRRPGGGRAPLAEPSSQWLLDEALIGRRRGHSRSCPLMCRPCVRWRRRRRLEPSILSRASGCKHTDARAVPVPVRCTICSMHLMGTVLVAPPITYISTSAGKSHKSLHLMQRCPPIMFNSN